jgi:hypothetical protein
MSESLPRLASRCAHWGWSDHRYFGHSVFEQLAGHESMMGMSALSVLGRKLPKDCCDVLEDIVCTSTLADPRVWPLKLTRLVASYGSTMPAVAAGLLIQEGARIGPWTTASAAEALAEFHCAIGEWPDDTALVRKVVEQYFSRHKFIPGFGTPYRKVDERLARFEQLMEERHRHTLPHWRTMLAVAAEVRSLKGAEPNIGIGYAAALLDMGVSIPEIGPLATLLLHHMFYANAVEGAHQAPELLRKLPDNHVDYVGVPARNSPRKENGYSFFRWGQAVRTG